MSAVMVSCFLIAWTPYAIMAMGATYGSPEVFTPSIAVLPALFAKSSTCYNPVIYVFMNKQVSDLSGVMNSHEIYSDLEFPDTNLILC